MRESIVVFPVIGYLLLFSSAARGDDKPQARVHFETGIHLQKSGEFEAAAVEYERSIEYYAGKNTLYNLANCYRALGRMGDAVATFRRILDEYDSTLKDATKADIHAQIEAIRILSGLVTVTAIPAGAMVSIDGRDVGAAPIADPRLLAPGRHTVEIFHDGYEPVTQKFNVESGVLNALSFELERLEEKAKLTIVTAPASAEVWVDGVLTATTPITSPIMVEKGDHALSIVAKGFETVNETLFLDAGQEETMTLHLTPIPPSSASPVVVDRLEKMEKVTAQSKKQGETGVKLAPLIFTGLGGTIIMSGVAGAMWAMAGRHANKYNDAVAELKNNEWDAALADDANTYKSDAEKFNNIAVGATIATGAFVVLMVTGLVLKRRGREKHAPEMAASLNTIQFSF